MANPVLVEVLRGDIVESTHRGSVAVFDGHGKLLFDFADIESYSPGSSQSVMTLMADDNCDYDSDANGSRGA